MNTLADADNSLLPIRVVQTNRDFLTKNRPGWSNSKIFLDDEELVRHQEKLETEISNINISLADNFRRFPKVPNVIKARLRGDALAKSHRPKEILNVDTCPIIGLDNVGELLLSSTKKGLERLKERISIAREPDEKANISAVEEFLSYSEEDKLLGINVDALVERAKQNNEIYLKVVLFNHNDEELNSEIIKDFKESTRQLQVVADHITKLEGLSIWRVVAQHADQVNKIVAHPSVRTVSFFPSFRIILPKGLVQNQKTSSFPLPVSDREYPKVVLVDTGISPKNKYLYPWVIDSEPFVPISFQNNQHGTFVAGLLSMPNFLNSEKVSPDDEEVQIIDVQMIPDSSKDALREDLLMVRLQEAVPSVLSRHDNAKIWNMSAGFDISVEDEKFSSFSAFLDKLQDEYGIIFVLPSGNYEGNNQREWPPQNGIGEADRLQIPGDSVRAITVGALACKERDDSIVRKKEPTSYSCRGPGPMNIIKPELVHYSGNLARNGSMFDISDQGIISFDENGKLLENVGTSFSCPLVSRSMAILHGNLVNTVSDSLLRALVVHNSYIPDVITDKTLALPYVGFGMPARVADFLSCKRSSITLVFDHQIIESYTLEYPFPWPRSLIDSSGRCRGLVRMTLVAASPLDLDFGSEYIRANIEASLSSRDVNSLNNPTKWKSRLDEYSAELNSGELYEGRLIKTGFKWKPIKRYEGEMKRIIATDWKIRVKMVLRDGFTLNGAPVNFALIFSLIDPDGVSPVYDEVTLELRNRGVITEPVQVRTRVQERVGVGS